MNPTTESAMPQAGDAHGSDGERVAAGHSRPLAVDLFCGLGGWTEGLLAEGWDVVGFDVERHAYGEHCYPAQLVMQDVRTINGAKFKDASLIVASSPCQEFSYRAMPWKRAKALGPPLLGMELFAQAERIQREAIAAAGRFIPMVQENVRGAQPWVGRARWHYGSYYLWGDVPALMPITLGRSVMKQGVAHRANGETNFHGVKVATMGKGWYPPSDPRHVPGLAFNTHAERQMKAEEKILDGMRAGQYGQEFERVTKNDGGSWFNVAHNTESGKGQNPDGRLVTGELVDGYKGVDGKSWIRDKSKDPRPSHGNSQARKVASARIAKIPLPLARHIARCYLPKDERR